MISVLASLVLGLLVATTKSSFDKTDTEVKGAAVDVIMIDRALRDYGPQSADVRALLRNFTMRDIHDIWPDESHADAPRITETQAGIANLSVGSGGLTSVQSVLTARAERRFPVGETMALAPTARVGWVYEFADTNGAVGASFGGLGDGAPFSVRSATVERGAALIGLGATLRTGGPVSVYLAYDGAFAQNSEARQGLTLWFSGPWPAP